VSCFGFGLSAPLLETTQTNGSCMVGFRSSNRERNSPARILVHNRTILSGSIQRSKLRALAANKDEPALSSSGRQLQRSAAIPIYILIPHVVLSAMLLDRMPIGHFMQNGFTTSPAVEMDG
jgi:hypothetical protein